MRYVRDFIKFLVDAYRSRWLLLELTKNDFKSRYLGSYLGVVWVFAKPLITIGIFWFVFQKGFRIAPVHDVPYILHLSAGIIPWFFITDCLVGGVNAVTDKGFLVSKVNFRVSILPITKILSSLAIHVVFVVVLYAMLLAYGYEPSLYHLQVFYYMFAMFVLLLGASWITSSIAVFVRDVSHFVEVCVQMLFWLTPILWKLEDFPAKYHLVFKGNPFFYIIRGYRQSLLYETWFWENRFTTPYFWTIALGTFVLGTLFFRRLRPHFGDVL